MSVHMIKNQKFNALVEQGFISMLNFGAVFVLSKYLSISDFSQFIVIYSLVSFSYLLTTFFIASPVLIFLPKYWMENKKKYLFNLILLHIIIASIIVVLSFSIYGYFVANYLTLEVFAFAVLWSGYELFRKYVFASGAKIYGLSACSVALTLVFFILIFLSIYNKELELSIVFRAYCIAYSVAILLFCIFFLGIRHKKSTVRKVTLESKSDMLQISTSHFEFSKWLILGGIAFWAYNQGYYVIAANFLSDLELGKVRTIQNLLGLFSIFMVVFENYYTPKASDVYAKSGSEKLTAFVEGFYRKKYLRNILIYVLIVSLGVVAYNYIYREKYGNGNFILMVFAVMQLVLFLSRPLIIALRAKEITYPFTLSHFISAIFVVSFGLLLMYYYKDAGMAVGFLISSLLFLGVIYVYYRKKVKKE